MFNFVKNYKMLQLSQINENKEELLAQLKVKGFTDTKLIEDVILLDKKRKKNQVALEGVLESSNKLSKEIGELFKQKKVAEANSLKEQTAQLKEDAKSFQDKAREIEQALKFLLLQIPNVPHKSVPKGKLPEDNELIFQSKHKIEKNKDFVAHWDLAEKYDTIDFELGNKITGAGFPVYKGKGAQLQRALINFFLDKAAEAGFREVQVPILVNEASGIGTGQLPDKEGQMYHVANENLYLIPTAEVPITNIFRDVILNESDLPVKYTGYTPCFRREAGSYGKDVRGLNRLHQFDKVEIVQIAHPDKSYKVLEEMVAYVKSLLEMLEMPFRIIKLCGGDMGFTSALTYDFEVYSPAQDKWLEVSSVSNFESYQANRLKLRFKDKDNKKILAHTLNGSALALPRIVATIMENFQTKDGVRIPKCLETYCGFDVLN